MAVVQDGGQAGVEEARARSDGGHVRGEVSVLARVDPSYRGFHVEVFKIS